MLAASGLPQFDISAYPNVLFWLVVSFGLLYFLVQRSGISSVQDVLDSRENKISDDTGRARDMSKEAESLKTAFEDKLLQARHQANEEVRNALEKASQESRARQDARIAHVKQRVPTKAKQRQSSKVAVDDPVEDPGRVDLELGGRPVARTAEFDNGFLGRRDGGHHQQRQACCESVEVSVHSYLPVANRMIIE